MRTDRRPLCEEGMLSKLYDFLMGVLDEFYSTKHKWLKLFWIFLLASLIGAGVEIVFVRVTAGVWMSRSSLLYGQFSVIWGAGATLMTVLLHRLKSRDDRYIFICGTVLGGAYEYLCSFLGELVFGVIFWDYSALPFNIGGRINLLYCFFWGFAAVIWVKNIYPFLSEIVNRFFVKQNRIFASIFTVFMILNITLSAAALIRYGQRQEGIPADNAIERFLDEHYDDEYLEYRYQNMKTAA